MSGLEEQVAREVLGRRPCEDCGKWHVDPPTESWSFAGLVLDEMARRGWEVRVAHYHKDTQWYVRVTRLDDVAKQFSGIAATAPEAILKAALAAQRGPS